ncbi:MAG: hypothetical protein ACRC1K_22375 [Planctomycetia bacterium]
MDDEVLREIRAVREAFAAKYDYDVEKMGAALRRMDEESEGPVVTLPPRRPAGYVAKTETPVDESAAK